MEKVLINRSIPRNRLLDDVRFVIAILFALFYHMTGPEQLPLWVRHPGYGSYYFSISDMFFPSFLIITGWTVWERLKHSENKYGVFFSALHFIMIGLIVKSISDIPALKTSYLSIIIFIFIIVLYTIGHKWNQIMRTVMIATLLIYTSSLPGFTISWWGILGIFGLGQMVVFIFAILIKQKISWLPCLVLATTYYTANYFEPNWNRMSISFIFGSHSFLVAVGFLIGSLLDQKTNARFYSLIVLTVALALITRCFEPPSKVMGTMSYALESVAVLGIIICGVIKMIPYRSSGRSSFENLFSSKMILLYLLLMFNELVINFFQFGPLFYFTSDSFIIILSKVIGRTIIVAISFILLFKKNNQIKYESN